MKKILYILAAMVLLGCQRHEPVHEPRFWLGADISGTTELEQKGVQLLNAQGEPRENTQLMREIGMSAIRLRVWVNPVNREWVENENGEWVGVEVPPTEGFYAWSSKEDVLELALRAKAQGMALMIDFHYSDWWADPNKQNIPAAWQDMSYEEMRDAAAEHTRSVLYLLKNNDIEVRWVQIGNETTHGFLWPMARAEEHMDHYAGITDACYEASKSVYPDAPCIVHIDCGSDLKRYRFLLDGLREYGARYDMIGMSMYPYWDMQEGLTANEDETLAGVLRNIGILYREYGRETMVVEIGYHADQADAGYAYLLRSLRALRDETDGHCKGVFYWAPEAEGAYPLGAFRDHRPTHIMDAFTEVNADRATWHEPVQLDLYGRGQLQIEAGTLQDFYKLHYQSFFGAEHLAPDTASVLQYLQSELDEMQTTMIPDVQHIGGYYRVSLALVKQGLLSVEDLAYAFIESARPVEHGRDEWSQRWQEVETAVLAQYPELADETLQRELREAARQNAAVRHSQEYREYYHPHYRIVRADVMARLIGERGKR